MIFTTRGCGMSWACGNSLNHTSKRSHHRPLIRIVPYLNLKCMNVLPIIVTYIKVFSNPDLSTWSHGNSYIFYKVANSYKFVWPHSYEFVWFLRNHMYFTSPPIHMNLYKWPTPNPTPKPTRHWGLDKSYKIVRLRSYKFVRIIHLVKYVRIGREIYLTRMDL